MKFDSDPEKKKVRFITCKNDSHAIIFNVTSKSKLAFQVTNSQVFFYKT